MQRYNTLIADDNNLLDLIEKGSMQLKSKVLIERMTEIINDMNMVRKEAPDHKKNIVTVILVRAYWNRAHCYLDEGKPQLAMDDLMQVDQLNPGNKDVKENINLCKAEMREHGVGTFFADSPQPDVITPKAQRIEPNGSDQKRESPQGEYVKLGRQDSAFYKHEKSQRPQSPTHHHHSQNLNQPGGKTGSSKNK